MVVNIEEEYCNYLRDVWERLSDVTKDILGPHQEPEDTYNTVSLSANQFLCDKLKHPEIEDG